MHGDGCEGREKDHEKKHPCVLESRSKHESIIDAEKSLAWEV